MQVENSRCPLSSLNDSARFAQYGENVIPVDLFKRPHRHRGRVGGVS